MGRQSSVMISYSSNYQKCHSEKNNMEEGNNKKGAWSREEDRKLTAYIGRYGIWNWNHMPKPAGLARSGKSCRLRWMNYLKPGVRHGNFTKQEEDTIIKWHHLLGNKWSTIASKLEGRTDNEIKNYWHTRIKKRVAKALHKPTTQHNKSSLPSLLNKVAHSSIIISQQSLTQAVNNEAASDDHNTATTSNTESELGSLLDYTIQDEFSVNNGVDSNTSPCIDTESAWPLDYSLPNEFSANEDVLSERSSGIDAHHYNIWQQLPSLDDMLMEADFGIRSIVSDSFTLPYNSIQETSANEYIYDLWGSL